MRRIVAAIILLSFAVGLSLWSETTYSKHMESFIADIEKIIEECDKKSTEEIIKYAEKTAEKWHKTDDLLHSLVVHDGMDDLEEIITSLPEIAKHSGIEELKAKCVEAVNIIRNLLESERLSIGNVLQLCINCKIGVTESKSIVIHNVK